MGPLTGSVNDAAVFRDAALDSAEPTEVVELITTSLAPALIGSGTAIRHLLVGGGGGAIVSHQAQPAVRGRCPTPPRQRASRD